MYRFHSWQTSPESGRGRWWLRGATSWPKPELLPENEGTGYWGGWSACDTNPPCRTFWRSVSEVGTSLTNPCWWALSGTVQRSGIIQYVVFTISDSFHWAEYVLRFINVMYLLTYIFICLLIYVFHTCRWYLRVAFDDRGLHTYRTETLSLVGHLVAKAWTAAGKLRDRKRGGMICDTNPPHRIFWRRKWNVGNSWPLPRRWALSRHDKEVHSFL